MPENPPSAPQATEFEGDYRPAAAAAHLDPINARIEPADVAYLMKLTDALNTTLDLQTLLTRTSELVRAVINYRIFAILLLNDRTHELRVRFQIGHNAAVEKLRIPVGKGVVGQVALTRQPVLINDVSGEVSGDVSGAGSYFAVNPEVRSELAVPLIAKNRLIGVMDLESTEVGYFTPEHLRVLTVTASRIAQAIENARLYARVSRQAQQLEVLNEIAVELASILELGPLLERVGQLLRRLIDYQMFTIMLLDDKGETLITRYAWRFGYAHAPLRRIPANAGLVGAAVREWRFINVPEVSKDPRYLPMNEETRSELVVPLFYKGRIIGVLDLEHTRPHFFTEEHERVLTTLAAQVAIAIENARLYQAVRRQEQQLERDIAMAREVQLRLLPAVAPSHAHAEMAVRFLPARTIGGDLYDFVDYGPSRTAIVLGDVSGKAAPAALFAALVSGIMRAAAATQPEPAADALPAQRCAAGAQARIAVRYHALRALERREPDACGSQLGRRAARLLPLRTVDHRQGRRLPARPVSQRRLRRSERRHAARRRHCLCLRRNSRCGEREGRDVRPGAIVRPAVRASRPARAGHRRRDS